MRRILSALVLGAVVVGCIWWLPPVATLILAEVVLLFAHREYVNVVGRVGAWVPEIMSGMSVLAVCAVIGQDTGALEVVLFVSLVAVGLRVLGSGRHGADGLRDVSVSLFAPVYLGLPVGTLVAVHRLYGREAILTLILTVMASDVSQYYGGRLLGRRPLAPAISPKKTREGALAGMVGGTAALAGIGHWWLPTVPLWYLILLGGLIVVLGIAGDLFESMLKRAAGLKDASGLIPGHGGILDRLDSLLFAAPVFYVFLRYVPR